MTLPPADRPSIRFAFSSLFLANAMMAVGQLTVFVLLARMGSEAIVGRFVFALSVWAPVILFASFRLRAVLTSDAREEYEFSDYLGLEITSLGVALVVVGSLSFWLTDDLDLFVVLMAVGMGKAFEILGDLCHGLFQLHNRTGAETRSKLARSLLGALGVATGILLRDSLAWATLGLLLAGMLVYLGYELRLASRLLRRAKPGLSGTSWKPRFNRQRLTSLARLALPLGITAIVISLTVNVPRYFVKVFATDSELGIFGTMTYFISAATLVMNALCNSVLPTLSQHYSNAASRSFRRLLGRFVAAAGVVGLLGVAVAAAIGRDILRIVLGFDDPTVGPVLVLVMIGGAIVFVAHTLQFTLVATRHFSIQVPVLCADLITTTVACALLVPAHGLIGAALAGIAGSIARVVGFSFGVRKALRLLANQGSPSLSSLE